MHDLGETGSARTQRELTDLIEQARQEVYALCRGSRKWRMSIPVQQTDSDLVISGALEAAEAALTAQAERIARLELDLLAATTVADACRESYANLKACAERADKPE